MAKKAKPVVTKPVAPKPGRPSNASNYPRQASPAALRIPNAILDQNAGKPCTDDQAAGFVGLASAKGPTAVEISSGIKYGFLTRPSPGHLEVTELSRQILRPKAPSDIKLGHQQAVLNAPVVSDVYLHYRGENLPDRQFFDNALEDSFGIPKDKLSEFKDIFRQSLDAAGLTEEDNQRVRILYPTNGAEQATAVEERVQKASALAGVQSTDTCFVMMPFASPIGNYYELIYKPAIEKAGLTPVRADTEIFATGKIMDQVWSGINAASVLVAELTTKNPNVFYELGIAHALKKPVVLVSANEQDVPFDLKHIRVIYYDMNDPFWGQKLLTKVAENILSAITNPEEAIFNATA